MFGRIGIRTRQGVIPPSSWHRPGIGGKIDPPEWACVVSPTPYREGVDLAGSSGKMIKLVGPYPPMVVGYAAQVP